MGGFGYISSAKEDEFYERHRLVKRMGKGIQNFIVPHMPEYVYGTVDDMGIPGHKVSGCWICTPPHGENGILPGKIKGAANICKQHGAGIIVMSPDFNNEQVPKGLGLEISWGCIYRPSAFIDGVRMVSALMGIDFKRGNVCIANASTHLGIIVAELLADEVSNLILCTDNKDMLMGRMHEFLLNSGLSPAVVSNYKKAMSLCDILFYTGGCDTSALLSFINRKALIVNLTSEKVSMEKDFLLIDEVLLEGENKPVINGGGIQADIFMTSRVWEGALLTLCNFTPSLSDEKKALEVGTLAKRLGIRMVSAARRGRPLDNITIYRYR